MQEKDSHEKDAAKRWKLDDTGEDSNGIAKQWDERQARDPNYIYIYIYRRLLELFWLIA